MGVSLLETYLRGGSSEVSQTSEPGGCWKEQWRSAVGGRRSPWGVSRADQSGTNIPPNLATQKKMEPD